MWTPEPFTNKVHLEVWLTCYDAEVTISMDEVDPEKVGEVAEYFRAQLAALDARWTPAPQPTPKRQRRKKKAEPVPTVEQS